MRHTAAATPPWEEEVEEEKKEKEGVGGWGQGGRETTRQRTKMISKLRGAMGRRRKCGDKMTT
jgi:hypothetical protein